MPFSCRHCEFSCKYAAKPPVGQDQVRAAQEGAERVHLRVAATGIDTAQGQHRQEERVDAWLRGQGGEEAPHAYVAVSYDT